MDDCAIMQQAVPPALIDSLQKSVLDVFPGYFGPISPCGEDTVKGAGIEGIIGIISFVGTLPWTLILALPQPTAVSVADKFAGFEIPYDSEDMIDAVGELVNIWAGAASREAETAQVLSRMSLPSVARGNLQMRFPSATPIHRLHYMSPTGPFCVMLVTSPSR